MKTKIICTMFMFFPLTMYCHSTDSTTSDRNFSLGLSFSPDYCYRKLKPDASVKWIADQRDSMEIPKFGFTSGVNALYRFRNKIIIEAGIQYSEKGYKTKEYVYNYISPTGQPDPAVPKQAMWKYSYRYLDIPIKIDYSILTGRLNLFFSGGISSNIFLSEKITIIEEFQDGSIKKGFPKNTMTKYSPLNFSVLGGLGIDFALTKRIHIRVEPTYGHFITSIIDAPIKGYLFSTGLNTGVYLNL